MVEYALRAGAELQKILNAPDTTVVIGGSLGYGAEVRGRYDIDLRILYPSTDDAEKRMKEATVMLHEKDGWSELEMKGDKNDIYHLDKKVKIEGLPENADTSLEINILLQSEYFGMAALAKQLPEIIIDRLIIAKALSKPEGKDVYKRVKKHWQEFLIWLDANGYRNVKEEKRKEVLVKAQPLYPLFLKDGEQN